MQDGRYALPTPRPANLPQIPIGMRLRLPAEIERLADGKDSRPLLVHFFSPDCPCSRFNLDHIRALARQYSAQVHFIAVLQGTDITALSQTFRSLHLDMEAVVDDDGHIARAFGVYSTPQAVLLDAQRHLHYRGNYNQSRYCASPQTEFARLALETLLAHKPLPDFPKVATIAYGCELPSNRHVKGGSTLP